MYQKLLQKTSAFTQLRGDIDAGRLSHCYIVSGADEELLLALVRQAVLYYHCPDMCGNCSNCVRIINGSHTSYLLTREEKIDVEMVSAIIREGNLTSSEGEKFFVISNASGINQTAQNKLLKTLEEAPPSTHFFLVATSVDMLLPTVRSRGIKLFVMPFSPAEIEDYLGDVENAEMCAMYSGGSISRALELSSDKVKREAMLYIHGLPSVLRNSRNVLGVSAELNKYAKFYPLLLDMLEIRFASMYLEPTSGYSRTAVGYAVDAVVYAKKMFISNCNPVAVIDHMLMMILKMRKKHSPKS